ncbi:hypothetical protein ACFX2G_004353 [Malus domestica]
MASIPPLQSSKFKKSRNPNPGSGPGLKAQSGFSPPTVPWTCSSLHATGRPNAIIDSTPVATLRQIPHRHHHPQLDQSSQYSWSSHNRFSLFPTNSSKSLPFSPPVTPVVIRLKPFLLDLQLQRFEQHSLVLQMSS